MNLLRNSKNDDKLERQWEGKVTGRLEAFGRRNLPMLTYRVCYPEFRVLREIGSEALICEVGAGTRRFSSSVINVDIVKGPNIDIVCDAHYLPFREQSLDLVFIMAVLEHVKNPWRVAEEIHRIVKKGGKVLANAPFLQPFHADPTDYFRFTLEGLRELFKEFTEIESGITEGPGSTVTWVLFAFAGTFTNNSILSGLMQFLAAWLFLPLKYLDRCTFMKKKAPNVASGFYFYGERRT